MDELAIREEGRRERQFGEIVETRLDQAREIADALAAAVKSSEGMRVAENTIATVMQGMYEVALALTGQAENSEDGNGEELTPGATAALLLKVAQGVKTLTGAQQAVEKLQTLYNGRRKRARRAQLEPAKGKVSVTVKMRRALGIPRADEGPAGHLPGPAEEPPPLPSPRVLGEGERR